MKRFLITLSLSLLLLPAIAQDIYVESNGNNTAISFNSFEKITFNGTTVTISETGGKEKSYNLGDIDRIHFGYYQSGISENIQEETSLMEPIEWFRQHKVKLGNNQKAYLESFNFD